MLTAVGVKRQSCFALFCRARCLFSPGRRPKRFLFLGPSSAPICRATVELPVAGVAGAGPLA